MKITTAISVSFAICILFAGAASANASGRGNMGAGSINRGNVQNFRSNSQNNGIINRSFNNNFFNNQNTRNNNRNSFSQNNGIVSGSFNNNKNANSFLGQNNGIVNSSFNNNRNTNNRFGRNNFSGNSLDDFTTNNFRSNNLNSRNFNNDLQSKANDPKTVAFYNDGLHGIVGESGITHQGQDLVQKLNDKGDFIQFFNGTADINGKQVKDQDTSIWKVKGNDQSVPSGWNLVPQANPGWGNYLNPNTDYIVKTFDSTKNMSGQNQW